MPVLGDPALDMLLLEMKRRRGYREVKILSKRICMSDVGVNSSELRPHTVHFRGST